jgi:hypothetical protein
MQHLSLSTASLNGLLQLCGALLAMHSQAQTRGSDSAAVGHSLSSLLTSIPKYRHPLNTLPRSLLSQHSGGSNNDSDGSRSSSERGPTACFMAGLAEGVDEAIEIVTAPRGKLQGTTPGKTSTITLPAQFDPATCCKLSSYAGVLNIILRMTCS